MPATVVAAWIAEARAILAHPYRHRVSLIETAARVLIQWDKRAS